MKVRHVLIIVTGLFLLILMFLISSMSYQAGVTAGANDPSLIDKTKDRKLSDVAALLESDTSGVLVQAIPMYNDTIDIKPEGFGRVISSSVISVTTEVQGKIKGGIDLKKGTKFKQGELLFSLENKDMQLALQARKSNYLGLLTALLPDLKIDFSDNFDSWQKFYSAIDVSQELPPIPSTKSFQEKNFMISKGVYTEYYNITGDQEKMKKFNVYAPFSGSVIDAFSDKGAIANPGAPILSIMRDSELEIEIPIKSQEIDLVLNGATVELKDEDKVIAIGKVNRKGNFINPQTQTIPVFIDVVESFATLYNGMYLTASIETNETIYAMEIPRKALYNKNEVFSVLDNQISSTALDIVLYTEDKVLVKGVQDGTVIVTEPIVNAKEGMLVSFANN